MLRNNLIFFLFLIVFSFKSYARSLQCSKNGTEIIYVNGVNNTKLEADNTRKKVSDVLELSFNKIDSKGNVSVSNVYNESLGTGNDIIEYVIDRARLFGIDDPWKYYKVFSVSSAIDGALIDKLKSRNEFLPAGFTLSTEFNVRDLALLSGIYNSYFTSTEVLKSSNVKLQSELRESILTKLTANKKVILVAHSQGNAVVNAATASLPAEINGVDKVGRYLGAVHVATPVSSRAAVKSRMIKLDSDRVVRYVAISENPNYEYNYLGIGGSYIPDIALIGLDYLIYNSPDMLGHNMSDIYLGERKARKIGSSEEYANMSEIFKKNVIEVAEELEYNCDAAICNVDTRGAAFSFSISGPGVSESFTLGNPRTEDYINNPIDCECKIVDLKPLQTYHVSVTSTDLACLTTTESGSCVPYPILPFDEDIIINTILNPFTFKFNFDATPSLPYGTFSVVRGNTADHCRSLIYK